MVGRRHDFGQGQRPFYHQEFSVRNFPPASERNSADHTAIGDWTVTPENDLLLLDVVRGRFGVDRIVPELLAVCRRWNSGWVVLEANGFQVAIVQTARGVAGMATIRQIGHEGKGKLVRADLGAAFVEAAVALPKLTITRVRVFAPPVLNPIFNQRMVCVPPPRAGDASQEGQGPSPVRNSEDLIDEWFASLHRAPGAGVISQEAQGRHGQEERGLG